MRDAYVFFTATDSHCFQIYQKSTVLFLFTWVIFNLWILNSFVLTETHHNLWMIFPHKRTIVGIGNLRQFSEFSRPVVKPVYYGRESISFLEPKIRDMLPDECENIDHLNTFKNKVNPLSANLTKWSNTLKQLLTWTSIIFSICCYCILIFSLLLVNYIYKVNK